MSWSRSRKSRRRGSNTEDTTLPAEPAPRETAAPIIQSARGRWAGIFAGTAFVLALVTTVVLMVTTGLFDGEENRRTILVWVALPLILTFASWVSVQSGHAALRAIVWLSVVFIAFFVWIAAFSIGPYYLPVVAMLMLAGFAPWPGSKPDSEMPPDPVADEHEGEKLEEAILRDVLGHAGSRLDK